MGWMKHIATMNTNDADSLATALSIAKKHDMKFVAFKGEALPIEKVPAIIKIIKNDKTNCT